MKESGNKTLENFSNYIYLIDEGLEGEFAGARRNLTAQLALRTFGALSASKNRTVNPLHDKQLAV